MRKAAAMVLLMTLLAGCAHSRSDAYPDAGPPVAVSGCSGIPSDPTAPAGYVRAGPATHGPGAPGVPAQLGQQRPLGRAERVPPLYVFDSRASMVHWKDGRDPEASEVPLEWMKELEFGEAERAGYWGEFVDGRIYRIPSFGPCELAQALPAPIELAAPPGGLLFLQFVSPRCRDCARLSRAIQRTIARHPQLPVRWVQVQSRTRVGDR
ncbi:hypothetical protein [Lysobacter enzymogenes]|uniref:hypothetical protein n=1 Tax=Lysobacter enzymogenes TaxID=69 RepID=UPI001A956AEE|nr:hypothetical protein [Lysobacter enzymogenes]QQP96184.1 hypothetical protein JHW38_23760 [Lysobacter enzymogenes]